MRRSEVTALFSGAVVWPAATGSPHPYWHSFVAILAQSARQKSENSTGVTQQQIDSVQGDRVSPGERKRVLLPAPGAGPDRRGYR